jgi:hypothetical protein
VPSKEFAIAHGPTSGMLMLKVERNDASLALLGRNSKHDSFRVIPIRKAKLGFPFEPVSRLEQLPALGYRNRPEVVER